MAVQKSFKKSERASRSSITEETFKFGMKYTDAPLPEGFTKLLVNYDFNDDGESLVPRNGLRATGMATRYPEGHFRNLMGAKDKTELNWSNDNTLFGIKETYSSEDKKTSQIIHGRLLDPIPALKDTYLGQLNIATVPFENSSLVFEDTDNTTPDKDKEDSLRTTFFNNSALSELSNRTRYTYFKKPSEYSIHDIPFDTEYLKNLARHIGTFAWQDSYYFFNSDGTLLRTSYSIVEFEEEVEEVDHLDYALFGLTAYTFVVPFSNDVVIQRDATTGKFTFPEWESSEIMLFRDLTSWSHEEDTIFIKTQNVNFFKGGEVSEYFVIGETTIERHFFKKSNSPMYKHFPVAVPALNLTVGDVTPNKYNMLSKTPYEYVNSDNTNADTPILEGVLAYVKNKEDKYENCLSFTPNQEIKLVCYRKAHQTTSYTYKFFWQTTGASSWNVVKSVVSTGLGEVATLLTVPSASFQVKVEIYKTSALTTVLHTSTNVFDVSNVTEKTMLSLINYDLSKCTGMVYWKRRLLLWGLPEDKTIMFSSYVDQPQWFPYSSNADVFDEPIVHCVVYGESLLVFTRTKLYLLSMSEDGMSWNKSLIQSNLSINEWEVGLIKSIKTMVFFKSGNYYYMVVPKVSSTGELTIAPISKPIEAFLDNFKNEITGIINVLYEDTFNLSIMDVYNFLDYDSIHNVYRFKVNDLSLNIDLVYNSLLRAWHIQIFESENKILSYNQDATKQGTLISSFKHLYHADELLGFQFLNFDNSDKRDFYICNDYRINYNANLIIPTGENPYEKFNEQHVYKNYQLIDTGYRAFETNLKKRFREVQFRINNLSEKNLFFSSAFYIDGKDYKRLYTYETTLVPDPDNPDIGIIKVVPVPESQYVVPGLTSLSQNKQEKEKWCLDMSGFPDKILYKARVKVGNGKGYVPRFLLISRNEVEMEIFNFSWVYREMNSR